MHMQSTFLELHFRQCLGHAQGHCVLADYARYLGHLTVLLLYWYSRTYVCSMTTGNLECFRFVS